MLTETFVIATKDPEKPANHSTTGVHFHELQPEPKLRSTFKKSSIKSHSLTISNTHVFAAQADKGVVHVYNKERNNQEAVVPFPDKIRSIELAGYKKGTGFLILGTEGGRLIIWEVSRIGLERSSSFEPTKVACQRSSNFHAKTPSTGGNLLGCRRDI